MQSDSQERKLTTILSADVVGYSTMMNRDENATLSALKSLRRNLIDPKTAQYRGRTVKLMGDGALVEFNSVVDAVRYAIDVQHEMIELQKNSDPTEQINFRIGIIGGSGRDLRFQDRSRSRSGQAGR